MFQTKGTELNVLNVFMAHTYNYTVLLIIYFVNTRKWEIQIWELPVLNLYKL